MGKGDNRRWVWCEITLIVVTYIVQIPTKLESFVSGHFGAYKINK